MPAFHNPSATLRRTLADRGVEPLTAIWHRAAFYEQPGNNFGLDECVDRAIGYVLRDPDNRFTYLGDAHSGTLTCQVPGCPDPHLRVSQPWNSQQIDMIEASHWDDHHRKEHGP